jgi:hypothetical protein
MCFNFATGVTSTAIFNQATRWQIREASGTTYFETSVDGANWITRLSATTPADMTATTVNVYTNPLFAGHNVTAAAGWWVSDLNTTQLADSWQPLSTGIVESWEEVTTALGSMSSVLVTCTDTMSVLAQVDTNAVTPVGAGETPSVRIQRLADAASWKFGTYLAYSGPARTMQATDLSMNRIGEMYLVADSVDELLFSGRDGRIWFGQKDSRYVDSPLLPIQVLHGGRLFFTSNPRIHLGSAAHAAQPNWVPASIDDFRTKNNDDLIIGTVTLARAGGSAVTTSDTTVNGRYQLRTYTRSDLVTQDPGSNADLTYVAGRILDRSDETYRPDAVVLDGKMSDKCAQFIFTMDVGLMVPIYTDHVSFIDVTICAYTIRILPLNEDELDISATINFEPNTVSSWARV